MGTYSTVVYHKYAWNCKQIFVPVLQQWVFMWVCEGMSSTLTNNRLPHHTLIHQGGQSCPKVKDTNTRYSRAHSVRQLHLLPLLYTHVLMTQILL